MQGRNRSKLYILAACFALIILGAAVVVFRVWGVARASRIEAAQATAESEEQLTKMRGGEVTSVIENFHSKWDSLEAMRAPGIRLDLAVTPFLNDYLPETPSSTDTCDNPPCLILSSVSVKSVRVLEYSPERFKAIACATAHLDRVTSQGELISSLPPYGFRHLYVFVRDKDVWKLAGLFDLTIPQDALRDWDYAPDWLKQVIGSLPSDILNCETQPLD